MRKVALAVIAPFVVVAAAFATPAGVVAQVAPSHPASPGHPGWSGPRALALSPAAPGVRTAPGPATLSSPACVGGFDVVTSPNGPNFNYLFASAAVGPNDVWAVGTQNIGQNQYEQPLAEHWNGTVWSIVNVPNPGPYWAELSGVSAISTNDVWVVGFYRYDALGDVHTFAAHWNGSSWAVTTSTFNPSFFSVLLAVTAITSSDVWAVGAYFDSTGTNQFALAEHWNGTSWTQFTSIDPSTFDDQLFSVSAFSSTDVWAVGSSEVTGGSPLQSLAEHWDGSSWNLVSTPNLGANDELAWVRALEPGHAVGVGYGESISGNPKQGEAWNLVSGGGSTNSIETGSGPGDNVLEGLDMSGPSVWAVGFSNQSFGVPGTPRNTLVIPATWNAGTHSLTWGTPGTSANPSSTANVLYSVSAVSPYTYWGVGFQTNNSGFDQTLIESYCALHFSLIAPVSTPSGSSFSVAVTVQNGSGATITGYLGTVHFTSSDPAATLPANYTFTAPDAGTHTFTGVVLRTPCGQSISVLDIAMPFTTPGSAAPAVLNGVCQGPGGTASTRGAGAGPGGTASGRTGVNQSGGGTAGPRLPRLRPGGGSGAAAMTNAAAATTAGPPTAPQALQQPAPAGIWEALLAALAVDLSYRLAAVVILHA